MRSCAVCFHFRRDGMLDEGNCLRDPPKVFVVHDAGGVAQLHSAFPVVGTQDRCGEFNHRNGPKVDGAG